MRLRRYTNKFGETREELVLSREEQEIWYKNCIERVLNGTREVLDNLEYTPEFKVNWENYHKKRCMKGFKEKHL